MRDLDRLFIIASAESKKAQELVRIRKALEKIAIHLEKISHYFILR
jgi:hypothetical protein